MFVSENPDLMKEWDFEKNEKVGLHPELITCGSNKKAWWKCAKGHSWDAPIKAQSKSRGCPVCSGRRVMPGVNDLQTLYPEIAKEWDVERNQGTDPSHLAVQSNLKAWWKCAKGHSWQTAVYNRTKGSGCPVCSNRKLLVGYNDLQTVAPDLLKDWDYSKNRDIDPHKIVYTSCTRVRWKCHTCGREWETPIRDRALYKHGCTVCNAEERTAHHIATFIRKNGSLADLDIAKEWNKERNGDLAPENFTRQSGQKVWWKCPKCGHEWEAKINNRVNGRGCPCCSNKEVVPGVNDLKTTNPELAAEWNNAKNKSLTPEMVTAGCGRKVWWTCPKGHTYQATVLHRAHGTACPKCNSGRQTSFAEQAVYFYIKQIFPDAVSRCQTIIGERMELDIFIPSIRTAIEYDGSFWHQEAKADREKRKYNMCRKQGIKLIRIKEKMPKDGPVYADDAISAANMENLRQLASVIRYLLDRLDPESSPWTRKNPLHVHSSVSVDLKRDNFKIRQYMTDLRGKSLADLYPEIAAEWHPTRNEGLRPSAFSPGSSVSVWWKCRICGHEWQTSIYCRTKSKAGCPACYNKTRSENHAENKTVYQYAKDGTFIKEWRSISEAGRRLSINTSNISMCAQHKRNIAGGYVWEYEKTDFLQMSLFPPTSAKDSP